MMVTHGVSGLISEALESGGVANMSEIIIPETIDDAFLELDKIFTEQMLGFAEITNENDMIMYHSTFGRWMRNNWGLWDDSPLAKRLENFGIEHPDEMSDALLRAYWCYKHGKPYKIGNRV
jgi:hypothetical protein